MKELFKKKNECCGCEACSQACPVSIINMKQDSEGFFYPTITDHDKCIDCKRCEQVCPEKHRIIEPREVVVAYTGFANQESEIKESASGGVCTTIAKKFIADGGVVYGVSYAEDFRSIQYCRAESLEELEPFRGSKYAQSRKSNTFKQIIRDLKDNIRVLFIGLPCDVAAVYNFTGNKNDKLYTIELICHGVTSPKAHEQFVTNDIEQTGKKLTAFSVRYKKTGWKPYYVFEKYEDGETIIKPFKPTAYNTAFIYFKRPSCTVCHFKVYDKQYGLQADITVGDNHGATPEKKSYNKWGSSVAFVHSEKGKELIKSIEDTFMLHDDSSSTDELIRQNLAIYKAFPEQKERGRFSVAFQRYGLIKASNIPCIKVANCKSKFKDAIKAGLIFIYVKSGLRKHKSLCIRVLGIIFPKYRKTRNPKH